MNEKSFMDPMMDHSSSSSIFLQQGSRRQYPFRNHQRRLDKGRMFVLLLRYHL
jgi:hypothetical protein